MFVGSALVHSYLRFGFTEDAHHVFDELAVRDVVLWNAMINGLHRLRSLVGQWRFVGRWVKKGLF